jgi:hypothetical protein
MRPTISHLAISVRTDALFASTLQRTDEPSTTQVRQAVAAAVRQLGGPGCAGRVAQEFGDHPDIAARRMKWARRVIAETYDPAVGRAA